jgi:hypothetical protein
MRYWLGRTLRETREAKGKALIDIVTEMKNHSLKVSEAKLSRFESGTPDEQPGEGWPRGLIDEIVVAYAQHCDIDDGRDLWKAALHNWTEQGGVPVLGELTPQLRSQLLAAEARQRMQPDDGESRGAPTSRGIRRKAR